MTWGNKRWLITGSSSGLGRSLASEVLANGGKVALAARNPSAVVDRYGDSAIAIRLDVTQQDQIEAAVRDIESRFGGIDVLVNNAGYGFLGGTEETRCRPEPAL